MANSLISMIKGDSTLINNTEVLDGQVLFNTDEKTILLDDDNTRTKYCGADKSNKNLAPIENGNTATRGYAAGSYVVWKEQLYKVLTQINSGTAFVVGTNIALDTVGAELTQSKSDFVTYTNNLEIGPNYGNLIKYQDFFNPTSTPHQYTFSYNGMVFISARRTAIGNTLSIKINDNDVFILPADVTGICGLTIPVYKTQVMKILTDSASATWIVSYRYYAANQIT